MTPREIFKYNNDKLKELLKELPKRGFIPADTNPDPNINTYSNINTTYLCAQKGNECNFYDIPKKYIYSKGNGKYDVKGGLTDGKGGWIYYEGKWAINTSEWWIREQRLNKILDI